MSKTYPYCIANASGCHCEFSMTDADVLLRELKTAHRRSDKLAGLLREAIGSVRALGLGLTYPQDMMDKTLGLADRINAALAAHDAGKEGEK